jgi:hypothetical protein
MLLTVVAISPSMHTVLVVPVLVLAGGQVGGCKIT